MTPPNCPVTGEPAVRRVQWVSARLLVALWRYECGVDVRPSLGAVRRFGLWESPTGLYFYDPMLEGDHGFYDAFYRLLRRVEPSKFSRVLDRLRYGPRPAHYGQIREEFRIAARAVQAGDRVLDIGCGPGIFRHLIPQASYTGLDKHFGDQPGEAWLRSESLADHLGEHAGSYDVVCAFQVLEHVADPVALLADMRRAAKPGGQIIVAVPHVPSAHARLPNYMINALPHHLTWWTDTALRAIAARVGLSGATIEVAPWGRLDSIVYWRERCSLVKCRDVHYRHSWAWHASTLLSYVGALLLRRLRSVPQTDDEGASLVLMAAVPGDAAGPS